MTRSKKKNFNDRKLERRRNVSKQRNTYRLPRNQKGENRTPNQSSMLSKKRSCGSCDKDSGHFGMLGRTLQQNDRGKPERKQRMRPTIGKEIITIIQNFKNSKRQGVNKLEGGGAELHIQISSIASNLAERKNANIMENRGAITNYQKRDNIM